MRKCYSWIVVLVILGLLLPTNAFASIGDSTGNPDLGRSHVVFEKERITDPAVLFERARQEKPTCPRMLRSESWFLTRHC